jgi:hypothetical protein
MGRTTGLWCCVVLAACESGDGIDPSFADGASAPRDSSVEAATREAGATPHASHSAPHPSSLNSSGDAASVEHLPGELARPAAPMANAAIRCGAAGECTGGDVCCMEWQGISLNGDYTDFAGCGDPSCDAYPRAFASLECDGVEDCAPGLFCCARYERRDINANHILTGPVTFHRFGPSRCATACSEDVFCNTDDDCPGSDICGLASAMRNPCGFDDVGFYLETQFPAALDYRICQPGACWRGPQEDEGAPDASSGVEYASSTPTGTADAGVLADGARSQPRRAVRITVAEDHACAIGADGAAHCWGDDTYGQSTPPGGALVALDAIQRRTCGLTPSGEIQCWGAENACFRRLPPGTFRDLGISTMHGCAAGAESVACWGEDRLGKSSPPAGRFETVTTAPHGGCGLRPGGTVECWGLISTPTFGTTAPFVRVAANAGAVCVLDTDSALMCAVRDAQVSIPGAFADFALNKHQCSNTGSRICGLTRDGAAECFRLDAGIVTVADGAPGPFTSIATNLSTACGATQDGRVACWGTDATLTVVPDALR